MPYSCIAGACRMGRWGGELPAKAFSQKKSSSVNHCSKFIFNNVIVTLTIYSFCRLSDYFWSVDIKLMVAILECRAMWGSGAQRPRPSVCFSHNPAGCNKNCNQRYKTPIWS